MEQLAALEVLQATTEEIKKILGDPSQELRRPSRPVLERVSSKELVREMYPDYPEDEDISKHTMMMFYPEECTPETVRPGTEIKFLIVHLQDGKFVGYAQQNSDAVLPQYCLATAKRLIAGTWSKGEVGKTLGAAPFRIKVGNPLLPFGIRGISSPVWWEYTFQSPDPLAELSIDHVTLKWHIDKDKGCTFAGVIPEFIWRTEDSAAYEAGRKRLGDASLNEFRLRGQREQVANWIVSGPEYERVKAVLAKLLAQAPEYVQSVQCAVRRDKDVNAYAAKGPKGPFVIATTGLLQQFDDEELAWVVAHELGHIIDGHVSLPLSRLLAMAPTHHMYRWHQMCEYSADLRGVELMVMARYDPKAAVSGLRKITAANPSVPKSLATHPPGQQRVKLLTWYLQYRGVDGPTFVDQEIPKLRKAVPDSKVQMHYKALTKAKTIEYVNFDNLPKHVGMSLREYLEQR